MSYRKLENIDEKLLETIIRVGAEQGVPKATIKRVAALCDVTHIVVLKRFGSTRGSWDAAAKDVDTRGMEEMKHIFERVSDRKVVWNQMLDYFLEHRLDALYYISYINTVGFDPTENNPRNEEYLYYAQIYFGENAGYSANKYLLLWDYLTSMVFYYAEKIIHGYLPNNAESRELIYDIVFEGLNHL